MCTQSVCRVERGVLASALIKKWRYWTRHLDGDHINMQFENKEIGYANSLSGRMDDVPFHIYGMKEPDYIMKLMPNKRKIALSAHCLQSLPPYKKFIGS